MGGSNPDFASRRRLLVIDDDVFVSNSIRRALRNEWDVVVAHRISDALEWLDAGQHFDATLCDMIMPHGSGADYYEALVARSHPSLATLIFMSGGAPNVRESEFFDSVAAPRLSKPFDLATVRSVLNSVRVRTVA